MKVILAVIALAFAATSANSSELQTGRIRLAGADEYPNDWFGAQRAFPNATIPQDRWEMAVAQARVDRAAGAVSTSSELLKWQPAGPTNVGGRVTAVAGGPTGRPLYFGAANGGVFMSSDLGQTWAPIMDELGVPSIGALAVDPVDPFTLYVGTGESNTAIDNYDGSGLFRTRDSGASWEHLGLDATRRIARIAVDPLNPMRLYVAAMGAQFSTSPDRGLYRSTDGGSSWARTLFVNDSTGACDVVVNPSHPETVFCATWERVRRASYRRAYGPGCGIWRSVDFGATWTRLAGGLPTPSDSVGRIGLAIAPSRPSTIYAQIVSGTNGGYQGRGLYRSVNGGQSWTRRDASGFSDNFGGFGWYFGDCRVAPNNPDRIYALGLPLMRSDDGGVTFSSLAGSTHTDQHALWIQPLAPERMVLGNDGGVFVSADTGFTWTRPADLPITQFYAGTIDPSNASRLLGGTQDNNTVMTPGPPDGWLYILGGDGFYCLVDPTNPNVVFSEWQNSSGGTGPQRSTDGGGSFDSPFGVVASDRFNWCTPFVMDPGNHQVLLLGSQRVYRSVDNGVSYAPISGDLTTNPAAPLTYGTITTLAISPVDGSFYLAGTDDGRVWRSVNAGATWVEITAGLPLRWVTRVVADPVDANTIYVTLSGFTQDEHAAHVFRSTNRGVTWSAIDASLPDAPVNDLIVDPAQPQTLYAATDVGVYATRNLGVGWFPLGQGMPLQVVHDLTLHAASRTLVAATHGRSQWRLNLNELPAAVEPSAPEHLALAVAGPNPFRGNTRLTLTLTAPTAVSVAIYDAFGRRVRVLARRAFEPGAHRIAWDGVDERGRPMRAGMYFAHAAAPGWSMTRRLALIE